MRKEIIFKNYLQRKMLSLHRYTLSLILLSMFFYSNKVNGQKITQSELNTLDSLVNAGIDPYYVKTQDTFSIYSPQCIVRNLLQDKKGNYWFATWNGIVGYDKKIFTNYTLRNGLIPFHVTSCYEDKKGNLWFGTARGGMYCYDGNSFKLFTTKDGLIDNSVSCYAEDKDGNIWFGTDKGASRYDGISFKNFTKKEGLKNDKVGSIKLSKNGKLLFGCGSSTILAKDGGISFYDGKSFTDLIKNDSLISNNITSMLEDKDGNIWIGSSDGLFKYDGKTLVQITELPSYLCYYIIEDKKGQIWLSVSEPNSVYRNISQQTLYKYDGETFHKIIEKKVPGDNQIFGKTEDNNGNIWFGTMKGVCSYDGKTFNYFRGN